MIIQHQCVIADDIHRCCEVPQDKKRQRHSVKQDNIVVCNGDSAADASAQQIGKPDTIAQNEQNRPQDANSDMYPVFWTQSFELNN